MNITTRYNFEDQVYHITHGQKCVETLCPECHGTGRIMLKESYTCPSCYGKRFKTHYENTQWYVGNVSLTIGCVIVRLITDKISDSHVKNERQYMCYETGIGSGTLYNEDRLFLTKEGAQLECDRRNKEVNPE